jgi:hypothetical protein
MTVTPASTQRTTDQLVADKKKGATDKEIQVDPTDIDIRANLDVFAWQISDMPRIPREVIEHKLDIDPAFKPIKQKERRYTPERRGTIWL